MHSKQKWHLCFIRRNKPHNIQTIISFSFIYSVRNRHTPLALIGVFFLFESLKKKKPTISHVVSGYFNFFKADAANIICFAWGRKLQNS